MMNLHQFKSYHERALDQWNSTAMIIVEAMNTTPKPQRPQMFISIILALSDVAGANQARRNNITKGAEVILNSLLDGSGVPNISIQRTPPLPAPPTFGTRFKRGVFRTITIVFLIALAIGSFFAGRASLQPRIASYIPVFKNITIDPEASPEEIVQKFLESVRQRNTQQILALFHPDEIKKRGGFIIRETTEMAEEYPKIQEINMLSTDREETAHIIVDFVYRSGDTETGKFVLQKYHAQWHIMDFTI